LPEECDGDGLKEFLDVWERMNKLKLKFEDESRFQDKS
jgi:hypothetical protein